MTADTASSRHSLGSMIGLALQLARMRWIEFLALVICIHWTPRVIVTLFGIRYAVGSRDVDAIAAYGLQSLALAACGMLMQASVVAIGLDGADRRISPQAAIALVLRRLTTLGPWWLLLIIPSAIKVWIRWSAHSGAQLSATYYWQEFGGSAYFIALDSLLGLYPVIALAGGLGFRPTLSRTMKLMSVGRGTVLVLAGASEVASLALNLGMPYATALALNLGLGEAGYRAAYFGYVFAYDVFWAAVNLVWVQLYREFERAHDGIAPGEVARIFA